VGFATIAMLLLTREPVRPKVGVEVGEE